MNQIAKANESEKFTQLTILTDEEIDFVSGGHPILIAAAGVTAAFAALNAAEAFGEKLGKALYNATH
jgi:hypothetical protein